jgi:hypothetical protein
MSIMHTSTCGGSDGRRRSLYNGQPLKYPRTADRQFALYSIGWNEPMTAARPH